MDTYRVKMTNGEAEQLQKLSESEKEAIAKKTEKVTIKLSPRIVKKMKQITGLQGQISNDRILYEFVKMQVRNFAQ